MRVWKLCLYNTRFNTSKISALTIMLYKIYQFVDGQAEGMQKPAPRMIAAQGSGHL